MSMPADKHAPPGAHTPPGTFNGSEKGLMNKRKDNVHTSAEPVEFYDPSKESVWTVSQHSNSPLSMTLMRLESSVLV